MVLAVSRAALAAPAEPGVSHELAVARARGCRIFVTGSRSHLKEHEPAVAGSETVTFESTTAGDLPIDYRDGVLQSAKLNGRPIATQLANGHLNLAAIAGKNTVTIMFASNAAAAGKAITRYEDKDDGREYFYTLFVPMDASMAFPCFDQPDLKGKFSSRCRASCPLDGDWQYSRNATDDTHTRFEETRPISTYLFAFAAGPFSAVRAKNAGEPTLYVRKSQVARAEEEAPQVQQMAARGIASQRLLCAAVSLPQV